MTRWLRILAAIAALVGLSLAAATVALALLGVTIDVARWRDAAADRASAALGRPVRLEGALELTLGREATLRLGNARILAPPGFTTQDLVTLGDVAARFDLLAALSGRLDVDRIEATDIRLRLERAADGRVNWASAATAAPPERAAFEIANITLRDLAVEYHDARAGRRHVFAADELSANARWNEPLRLGLRGRAGQQVPYTLTVEGAPLRLLQEASAPLPFSLDFVALDTRLDATGTIDVRKGEARFDFGAGTEDFAQVERLLDTALPRFGGAALHGTAVVAADAIEIVELRGVLGESELAGDLALALGGARPRVSGALTFATFDLRPLFPADPAPGHDGREWENLRLRDLVPVDVDVDLRVRELPAVPGDLRDVRVELHADAQGVRAPIGATYAGVPSSGRLDLDTAAPVPVFTVELNAKDAALGDLAGALPGAAGIEGTLGRFGLRLAGRGETLDVLAQDLELALAVGAARFRYGDFAGGRPVAVTLDALDVSARHGERLLGSARGTLQGEPATLSFRGGTLSDMLRGRATPVAADLAAARAKLRIEGSLARADERRGSDLVFRLDARRAGDLARWLGIAPDAKLPLAMRGRLRILGDAWYLDGVGVKLGHSAVTIDARRAANAVTVVAVRGPLIDVPELATLGVRTGARSPHGARTDAPLLPVGIALPDADIGFGLERVALGRIDLVDVGLAAHIRDGRLAPSPIAAKLGDAPFAGIVALDLTGKVPEAALDLAAGAIDVGRLLHGLGVAEDIDGRADALVFALRARGSTVRELATQSSFDARLTGGTITVRGAAGRPVAEIGVQQAIVGAPAGGPIRGHVDGTLDETPVEIEVASATLSDFAHDGTRVPFSLTANAVNARFALVGDVVLPLGRGGRLTLAMGGERLDTLNGLARVELPPWGPWAIRGPIKMTATGYEARGLVVSVGENRLTGDGRLDVTGARPRLDVSVTAPSIQLDDFPLPERLTDDPRPAVTAQGIRATTRDLARRTERLLSAGFLRRLDVALDVAVEEVLSGNDRLADGLLRIQAIDGQLYLGPAQVNLPGGTVQLSIAYDPNAPEVELKAGAHIERFDYGILARRRPRGNDVKGLFSLNLELAGKAPSLDTIMLHADGKLDFAVWPVEAPAGIFNLWSVNLLLAVLPLIDPGGESHVNCIVGRFDLKEGVLTDDKIMIDTTRVRVRGAGSANLRTEALAFVFRPRAKGFPLFRLQTPLRVTGTLTDYRFGVTQRDWVESILRLAGSPILIPLERLTLGPLPRDGADVCTDPLRD